MPTNKTPEQRFKEKYTVDPLTNCWLWHGNKDNGGYGIFQNQGKTRAAHIYSWLWSGGRESGEGETLDHLCRNRNCVNPAHLEQVTIGENVRRGQGICAQHAEKLKCKNGHFFTEENTYSGISANGQPKRACKTCARERSLQRYYAKKARRTMATNNK